MGTTTLFYGFLNQAKTGYVFQSVSGTSEEIAFSKIPFRAIVVGSSISACEEELYCRQHDC